MYEQYLEEEHAAQEQQQLHQQMIAQAQNAANQLANQGAPVGQPGPVMNLQLPVNRQRPQGPNLALVPQGPARNGSAGHLGPGLNPLQPNGALQAQLTTAQQQVLATQIQNQSQNAQQREIAAASSPASMQGTPIMHNDSGMTNTRGVTPARVGSLQGGRTIRGSPNIVNAPIVSLVALPIVQLWLTRLPSTGAGSRSK